MCAALGLVMSLSSALTAQGSAPTPDAVRQLARESASRSRGDATALILELDRRVRERWGAFESFPISLVRREDLTITLTTPYMGYRRALANYLKIGRPLADVPWTAAAVVEVSPSRIGAPDIREVVVVRGGVVVPAIGGGLKSASFTDGSGAQGTLSAGEVQFPMSAFAPGAPVVVTVRPMAGDPFVYELSDEELGGLK